MSDNWLHLLRDVVDRVFELARTDAALAQRLSVLASRVSTPNHREHEFSTTGIAPQRTTGYSGCGVPGMSNPSLGTLDYEIATWDDISPRSDEPSSADITVISPVADQTEQPRFAPVTEPLASAFTAELQVDEAAGVREVAPPDPDELSTRDSAAVEPDRIAPVRVGQSTAELAGKLTFARQVTGVPLPRAMKAPRGFSDETTALEAVIARSQLKAEALRWILETTSRPVAIWVGVDQRLAQIAEYEASARKWPNCRMWMLGSGFAEKRSPRSLEFAAEWLEVMAEVASAVVSMLSSNPPKARLKKVIDLLAEAQAGVRVAVKELMADDDFDQVATFRWLRDYTQLVRFKIDRFMSRDHAPPVSGARSCLLRLDAIVAGDEATSPRLKQQKKLLGKLAYERDHLLQQPEIAAELWAQTLLPTLVQLLELGVPPSDLRLREILWGIEDTLPEELSVPKVARKVFEEIHKHAERVDRMLLEAEAEEKAEVSAEVQRCRDLLEGKRVVMIGGDVREPARGKIEAALGLKAFDWVETNEKHQSVSDFETHIARPDVAVVLLGIRWSRHAYGGVKSLCAKHATPMVWVPGGYNVNQLAHQIVVQSSDRLRQARA